MRGAAAVKGVVKWVVVVLEIAEVVTVELVLSVVMAVEEAAPVGAEAEDLGRAAEQRGQVSGGDACLVGPPGEALGHRLEKGVAALVLLERRDALLHGLCQRGNVLRQLGRRGTGCARMQHARTRSLISY